MVILLRNVMYRTNLKLFTYVRGYWTNTFLCHLKNVSDNAKRSLCHSVRYMFNAYCLQPIYICNIHCSRYLSQVRDLHRRTHIFIQNCMIGACKFGSQGKACTFFYAVPLLLEYEIGLGLWKFLCAKFSEVDLLEMAYISMPVIIIYQCQSYQIMPSMRIDSEVWYEFIEIWVANFQHDNLWFWW